jgi:hypothetical protein
MNFRSIFFLIALLLTQKELYSQDNASNTYKTIAFSEAETKFIRNYFRAEFQSQALDYDNIITENIETDSYEIFLGKEFESVPGCSFDLNWSESLIGSLGEPNSTFKFFHVEATGGGTQYWTEIYCLKSMNGIPSSVFQLDIPCPFNSPSGCSDRPELVKIDNNILVFTIGFVGPNDGNCCPSWEYEISCQFQANKLTLLSKRKVKQTQN